MAIISMLPGDWIRHGQNNWKEYRKVDDTGKIIVAASERILGREPRLAFFYSEPKEVVTFDRVVSIRRSDGYQFTFIKRKRGYVIVAGCHLWRTFKDARKNYRRKSFAYPTGKKFETLMILNTLERIAKRKGLL